MLQIKTHLDKSTIAGTGLFASEYIPKGTVIWKYKPLFTCRISAKKVAKFTEYEKSRLHFLSYYWVDKKGNYMIPLDHDQFMNHSRDANIEAVNDKTDIANRDININEELTIDYRTIRPKELWSPYF